MLYAIVAVLVLILDQGMKYWTTVNITLDTGVQELIPGFIQLRNIHNTGAAFGLLENTGWAKWLFIILTVVFVIVVIVALATKLIRGSFGRWTAVLVMAGAIGNCIDRLIYGYVVDMFEFTFISFPVFNVADIFIVVGGIAFCLYVIFHKDTETKEERLARAQKEKAARLRSQMLARRQVADIGQLTKDAVNKPVSAQDGAELPVRPAASGTAKSRSRSAQRTSTGRAARTARSAGQSARTVRPSTPPPAVSPEDPFAEWERLASVNISDPAENAPTFTAPAEQPEPKAEARPAPAPAADVPHESSSRQKVVVDGEEMEFSLEDILAEFGGKD